MKDLHLICNAHIDPVWLWDMEEGISAAISTFRMAAVFCEEYDGLVFNPVSYTHLTLPTNSRV